MKTKKAVIENRERTVCEGSPRSERFYPDQCVHCAFIQAFTVTLCNTLVQMINILCFVHAKYLKDVTINCQPTL